MTKETVLLKDVRTMVKILLMALDDNDLGNPDGRAKFIRDKTVEPYTIKLSGEESVRTVTGILGKQGVAFVFDTNGHQVKVALSHEAVDAIAQIHRILVTQAK